MSSNNFSSNLLGSGYLSISFDISVRNINCILYLTKIFSVSVCLKKNLFESRQERAEESADFLVIMKLQPQNTGV